MHPAEPRPIDRLRAICLALPEAEERETWEIPTFRVRDRIFAMAHPAVDTVIPGMADADEVAQSLALAALPLPPALWHDLIDAVFSLGGQDDLALIVSAVPAAAAAPLRDCPFPFLGLRIRSSQCCNTPGRIPLPSPPNTNPTEPVRSTSVMSSVISSAPNFNACLRMLSIKSGPMIPSGNPGKFSTSVVVISCPPRTPPACRPSNTKGRKFARAA